MSSGPIQAPRGDMKSAATWLRHWACLAISVLLAIATLSTLGLSPLGMILLIVFLACPVAIAWTLITARRPLQYPLGPVPATEGRTLDRIAPCYDVVCRIVGLGQRFRRRTIDLARLVPREHVLDAGCGTGALTRLAASAVGRGGLAIGIDAAPDMIRVANEQAATARSSAQFKLAAVEALPFGDESFDVAFVSLLLHHLPAELKRKALHELYRVLKTGGRLMVVDFDRPASRLWRMLMLPLHREPSIAVHLTGGTADLLYEAGFAPTLRLGQWGAALGFWGAFKPPRDARNA